MKYISIVKELAQDLEDLQAERKLYISLIKEIHNISSESIIIELIETKTSIRS